MNNTNTDFTRKMVRYLWLLFAGGLVFVVAYLFILSLSGLPTFEELENPNYDIASDILADDNASLGRLYIENRVPVTYNEISPNIVNALVSTEDERYFTHSGVDYKAVLRVITKTLVLGNRSSGGGSTITQQLAKLLYSDRDFSQMNSVRRFFALINIKLKEWITAVKLERSYTKEEIIAMYLNKFNFINGAYGIEAAAEIYFDKKAKDLDVPESALLVGMLQNPSLYNPVRRKEQAKNRRNTVIRRMVSNDKLSKAEAEKYIASPIQLNFHPKSHISGIATYFRMEVAKEVNSILRKVNAQKSDGSNYDIYRDGLKIYTTINRDMQRIAEDVMKKHMLTVQKRYWAEWKGKDPWKYDSNPKYNAIRENSLKNLVRTSDRYQNMRAEIFEPELEAISQEFPKVQFTDVELDIMNNAAQVGMDRSAKNYGITDEQKDNYTSVMKSNHYQEMMNKWQAFRQEVRKKFAEKTRMKVFAYNAENEKDTLMSPYDSIRYHRMFLQTGILGIDPTNGQIRVWVGGINHKYFKYDHIRTLRQVGSTFKPFVYASAVIKQGMSPCQKVVDRQYTINPGEGKFGLIHPWSPSNAEGKFSNSPMTLFEGLQKSRNSISVYLMKELGSTDFVRSLANNMGIDSNHIPAQPSICLGAADLTVFEMTGAYATFANEGTYIQPTFITRIEDKNGKVLYKSTADKKQAITSDYNYVMVEMLRYAVRGAGGFQGIKSDVGGKTGTTNDYVDGWFIGITPSLVVGTWVGGDDRWIRFLSLANGQGARMARPFFSEYIRQLEQQKVSEYNPNARFKPPAGGESIITDCSQYYNPNVLNSGQDSTHHKKGQTPGEDDFFE
jgi:penicillin-binding protein 1A